VAVGRDHARVMARRRGNPAIRKLHTRGIANTIQKFSL
jgi:hypothetical protein